MATRPVAAAAVARTRTLASTAHALLRARGLARGAAVFAEPRGVHLPAFALHRRAARNRHIQLALAQAAVMDLKVLARACVPLANKLDILRQELYRVHGPLRRGATQEARGRAVERARIDHAAGRHDALKEQEPNERVEDALKRW